MWQGVMLAIFPFFSFEGFGYYLEGNVLTVSGGFIIKCDECGFEIECDAEILDSGIRVEKRPLGDYTEHDFHADLKCRC